MEMEKVFQITGYKEIRDGNATIWRRAVPRQSAKGLLAQFSNTRKTGGDGVTYPAFAPNVVMPSCKLFGRTAKTIVIEGKRYVVPSDVTLVDYIESTGTQYIIIPHKLNSSEKVNVKYMVTARNTAAQANCPFGVTTTASSSNANKGCVRTIDGQSSFNRVGYGDGSDTVVDISGYNVLNTWYEAEYKPNGECYINGDLVTTLPTSEWTADYNFALFGRMTARNVTFNAIERIAHCIIGDSVVALPAVKNNVVGFWDAVTNAFFTPVGTLTAGPNRAVELYGVGDRTENLLDMSDANIKYGFAQKLLLDGTTEIAAYTDKQLNGVGAYEDALDFQKGELVRNVGVKVLDGKEEWTLRDATAITRMDGMLAGDALPGMCSHADVGSLSSHGIRLGRNDDCLYWFDALTDLGLSDIADFEAYLARQRANGTPVTVIYPLATPATSTVTPAPIALAEKGRHSMECTSLVKGDVQAVVLSN